MANKLDPQRLRQLELLLRWEGQVGNARLRELFGLTSIRASQWLREFREAQPRWVLWSSIQRSLNATPEFYRDRMEEVTWELDQYLSLVGLPTAMKAGDQNIVVAAFPDITTPNPEIFAVISKASRLKKAIEITYRSMREPIPHKRVLSPHSIVHAGRRWHVRAYCESNNEFRDYSLGRISQAKLMEQPSQFLKQDDTEWLTEVPVKLVAHPDLTHEQQSLICFEYFNNTAARTTTCRGPLVKYFIQDVRAAVDVKKQNPPEFLLAVGNSEEIVSWLYKS